MFVDECHEHNQANYMIHEKNYSKPQFFVGFTGIPFSKDKKKHRSFGRYITLQYDEAYLITSFRICSMKQKK